LALFHGEALQLFAGAQETWFVANIPRLNIHAGNNLGINSRKTVRPLPMEATLETGINRE
jgi:hypothetical protein